MQEPIFPKEFVRNHCPKVVSERRRRKVTKEAGDDSDDMLVADCSFESRGLGQECQSCKLFLTRPFTVHEVDRKFLPQIEQYYADVAKYEKYLDKQDKLMAENGSFI